MIEVFINQTIVCFHVPGVRKVRVHNLSLNCTTQMADIYRYCELDTLMNFMSKQCATKLCDTTPRALRDALVMLFSYFLL